MSQLGEVIATQKSIEASLAARMDEFEKRLSHSSTSQSPDLKSLSSEFKEFKESVGSILTLLRSQLTFLTTEVDELDNYNRRNALLFCGIEESDSKDVQASVVQIIREKLSLANFEQSSLLVVHRLGTQTGQRPRPILVRFQSLQERNNIWRNKKSLKSSGVVIREFLTKTRQAIFGSARAHFGMTACWTKDGAVYVKAPGSDPAKVSTAAGLNELIRLHPTATPAAQGTSSRTPIAAANAAAGPQRRPMQTRGSKATSAAKANS